MGLAILVLYSLLVLVLFGPYWAVGVFVAAGLLILSLQ